MARKQSNPGGVLCSVFVVLFSWWMFTKIVSYEPGPRYAVDDFKPKSGYSWEQQDEIVQHYENLYGKKR